MKYGIYYPYWLTEWDPDCIPFVEKVKKLGFDILEVPIQGFLSLDDEYLLRLKDLMNTDKGRELAESRHAYLQEYLKEYAAEVQVRRIQYYETLLQKAEQILRNENTSYPELELYIRELDDYYTGPAWKEDLAADEAGMLPAGLRRGVLSEDGIYNVLQE